MLNVIFFYYWSWLYYWLALTELAIVTSELFKKEKIIWSIKVYFSFTYWPNLKYWKTKILISRRWLGKRKWHRSRELMLKSFFNEIILIEQNSNKKSNFKSRSSIVKLFFHVALWENELISSVEFVFALSMWKSVWIKLIIKSKQSHSLRGKLSWFRWNTFQSNQWDDRSTVAWLWAEMFNIVSDSIFLFILMMSCRFVYL